MSAEDEGFLKRLAALQHRHAGVLVAIAFGLAGASLPLVMQLGLDSAWTALLPENKPSVKDLEEIGDRVGGLSTLTVGIESSDLEAMQRFATDLVPRLEALEGRGIRSVDWNIASYEQFVEEHEHLYADLDDLTEVRDTLAERLEHEKASANPFYVDLGDEPPDIETTIDRMRERAEEGRAKLERYPGGFYVHPDRDFIAVFVRSDIGGGDAAGASALIAAVDREVRGLLPASYAADMSVDYGGNLVVAREEHEAIAQELILATVLTIVLVLGAIWIFFRKVRAIGLLGLSLIPPVLVTFAIAELAVDYLNTSTAFLGSIVIGNGINPNIIWLARYFEERRGGRKVMGSLVEAHRGTWLATLTASLAAAIAYGSLVITDFRGFRDFGIIGGAGMVLCWLGAILVLPSVTALLERFWPLAWKKAKTTGSNVYGVLFSFLVRRFPRAILVVSTVLGLASVAVMAHAVLNDPMEYDFRRLKSEREGTTRARLINRRVGEIMQGSGEGTAIAVVVPSRDDARDLERRMEEHRAAHPDVGYGRVSSVDDLLPRAQEEKVPVLGEIRETLLELHRFADDEQRAQIDAHIPPDDVTPVTAEDLPEAAARPFTERDGTRGRILFVERPPESNIWDGRLLVQWSESVRGFRLSDGRRPPLTGTAPVFADMIDAIWANTPKAIGASFFATLLLVLLTFRRMREKLLTMLTLLLGIAWMGATMAVLGMRLNFLNVIAFPVTFGNGVDYGVNIMRRYAQEERTGAEDPVRRALEESGGAVVLCSLTTIIAYTSLYTSANLALNSFGLAMSISEVTCVFAAMLAMPAALIVWRGRKQTGTGSGGERSPAVDIRGENSEAP